MNNDTSPNENSFWDRLKNPATKTAQSPAYTVAMMVLIVIAAMLSSLTMAQPVLLFLTIPTIIVIIVLAANKLSSSAFFVVSFAVAIFFAMAHQTPVIVVTLAIIALPTSMALALNKKRVGFFNAVLILAASFLFGIMLVFTYFERRFGINIFTYFLSIVNSTVEIVTRFYETGGPFAKMADVPQQSLDRLMEVGKLLRNSGDEIKHTFALYLPSGIIISCGCIAFFSVVFTKKVLKLNGVDSPYLIPFMDIRATMAPTIIIIITTVVQLFIGNGTANDALSNLQLVAQAMLSICGVCFAYFFYRYKFRVGWVRGMIFCVLPFALIIFASMVAYLYSMLGMLDSFWDFRKRITAKPAE